VISCGDNLLGCEACAIARLLDTHMQVSVGGRLASAPAMNEMTGIRHTTTNYCTLHIEKGCTALGTSSRACAC
jgi:hypothetical protein